MNSLARMEPPVDFGFKAVWVAKGFSWQRPLPAAPGRQRLAFAGGGLPLLSGRVSDLATCQRTGLPGTALFASFVSGAASISEKE
jgi:hypothetical protein